MLRLKGSLGGQPTDRKRASIETSHSRTVHHDGLRSPSRLPGWCWPNPSTGTLIGAIMSLVLVELFSNSGELFCVALALWIGGATFVSIYLREAPQAYAGMLAGYSAAIVGLSAALFLRQLAEDEAMPQVKQASKQKRAPALQGSAGVPSPRNKSEIAPGTGFLGPETRGRNCPTSASRDRDRSRRR
jgi:Fusaric acid resistance protein family